MARPKSDSKAVTITIPTPLFEFIDALHWTEHKERAILFREAIEQYAVANGYTAPKGE